MLLNFENNIKFKFMLIKIGLLCSSALGTWPPLLPTLNQ